MNIYTATELRTYLKCMRRYFYEYVKLYRPAFLGIAFYVGIAVHKALEWFLHGDTINQTLSALDGHFATGDFWVSDRGIIERAKVRGMIRAYFNRWQQDLSSWKNIKTEIPIKFQVNDISIAGVIDAGFGTSDGKPNIADHKTTSDDIMQVSDPIYSRLMYDFQIAIYSEAIRQQTGQLPGICWDFIKKPSTKPHGSQVRQKKDESLVDFEARKIAGMEPLLSYEDRIAQETELVRRQVYWTHDQHTQVLSEVVELAMAIDSYQGSYPRNDTACLNQYGSCPFLGVCAGNEDLEASDKFIKIETKHPELDAHKQGR